MAKEKEENYDPKVCPPAEKGIVDPEDNQRNCSVCGLILQEGEYCDQERTGNPANG